MGPYRVEQTAQKLPGGNLTINPVQIPYDDFEAKYLAAFSAASGPPDLFIGQVANYAGALDVAEPLPKELADRSEKDVLKAISQFHRNGFLWPLLHTRDETLRTLALALSFFSGYYGTQYHLLAAGACVSVLPLLILFLVLQRQVVEGVALSGLKG
jgi:hypothetical protein